MWRFFVLCVVINTGGGKQVIDIFTNYPSTQEALDDYNRLLEGRRLAQRLSAPDAPEFLTASSEVTTEAPQAKITPLAETHIRILPKAILASATNHLEFAPGGASGTESQAESKVHLYFDDARTKYGGSYDAYGTYTYGNHDGSDHGDILESEFGTFENSNDYGSSTSHYDSDDSYSGYHYEGDAAKPSHQHDYVPGTSASPAVFAQGGSLLDLNSLIEVMATRPAFLTGTSLLANGINPSASNRKNATVVRPMPTQSDHVHFDPTQDVIIESDFGEIVSTKVDRHRRRKGHVQRRPKPGTLGQGQAHGLKKTPTHHYADAFTDDDGQGAKRKHKGNKHHVGKLHQMASMGPPGSKRKVTNLIRKYLINMRKANGTRRGGGGGWRSNRKQSGARAPENESDATADWPTANDTRAEAHTSAKLAEGSEKFLLSHSFASPLETIANKTKTIANKLLSLFTVIQFSNFQCRATLNSAVSQYEGTCYLASECAERNGIAMGMCAEGHGVCCVFRGTCGGVGSNNCTFFESPGYPNYVPQNGGLVIPTSPPLMPDPRSPSTAELVAEGRQDESADALACIFRVYKSSGSVKQMRIDFVDLELAGPTDGVCANERLIISGVGLTHGVPAICGYNTGQHVLVDVTDLTGPLQLAVLANMIVRKRYKIRICQYTDGCSGLINCLQSYTGVTGTIQSFNYDQAATFSRSTPGYFNNLNYAICIKREPGYCSVTYSAIGLDGVVYPFMLRNYDDAGDLTVPSGEAGAGVINCPDDYIVINGIRLCGDRLNDGSIVDNFAVNAPVTDTSGGPILIPVRTNGVMTSRGFKLFYTQNRCLNNGAAAGTPDPRS